MDNNLENILSNVTSNPELMNKISEIVKSKDNSNAIGDVMSILAPLVTSKEQEKHSNSEEIQTQDTETNQTPIISTNDKTASLLSSFGESISKNSPLLLALKPYLSKERAQMIDSIVKLSQIAGIMKLI